MMKAATLSQKRKNSTAGQDENAASKRAKVQSSDELAMKDAETCLGVEQSDESAATAVENIVILVNKIIEKIPELEDVLAKYPAFIDSYSYKRKQHPAVNKSALIKHMDTSVKFIAKNLPSYIEVLEGINDWYINAEPVERDEVAKEYLEYWIKVQKEFDLQIIPIESLFNVRDTLLNEDSHEYKNGSDAIIKLSGLLKEWLQKSHSYSAVGRAHGMKVSLIEIDGYKKNMTWFKDINIGGKESMSWFENINIDNKEIFKGTVFKEEEKVKKEEASEPLIPRDVLDKENMLKAIEEKLKLKPLKKDKKEEFSKVPVYMDRNGGQIKNMAGINASGYAYLAYRAKIDEIKNMAGINASGYAYLPKIDEWRDSRWEWLHLQAASLGGVTDGTNLVVGTRDVNTHMIPFEANIRALTKIVGDNKDYYEPLNVNFSFEQDKNAKHKVEKISIEWELVKKNKNNSEVKETKGKANFKPLTTDASISKIEVGILEEALKNEREKLNSGSDKLKHI